MKTIKFPYMGFEISWYFHDSEAVDYQQYIIDHIANKKVYVDLEQLLLILSKHQLLFPTYVIENPSRRIEIQGKTIQQSISNLKELILQKEMSVEILRIGGYGLVIDDNKEMVLQNDLIVVDSFRFFERAFCISTNTSIWLPIRFEYQNDYDWQINLAKNNSVRLENCLKEIKAVLAINVTPAEDELDRENPIWQKGFKLYVNPDILLREYRNNPPSSAFDIQEFLIEKPSK